MDWPHIEDGYLIIPTGPLNTVGVPLWFIGIVALIFTVLVVLAVVAIAAAMSNKRRGQNP
jgi:hypothetical protein